jgi:hypothetical protein
MDSNPIAPGRHQFQCHRTGQDGCPELAAAERVKGNRQAMLRVGT